MDVLLFQMPLHIRIVHAPDPLVILYQGRVNQRIAVVPQSVGKPDIGGGVNQNLVAFGAEHVGQGHHAAQNAIYITNMLRGQSFHAVAAALPGADAVIVFVPGRKVAEKGMLQPLPYGLGNGGHRGEIHIRHPHGDQIEALLWGLGAGAVLAQIHGQGIFSAAVINGCKIVFHGFPSFCLAHIPAELFQ